MDRTLTQSPQNETLINIISCTAIRERERRLILVSACHAEWIDGGEPTAFK